MILAPASWRATTGCGCCPAPRTAMTRLPSRDRPLPGDRHCVPGHLRRFSVRGSGAGPSPAWTCRGRARRIGSGCRPARHRPPAVRAVRRATDCNAGAWHPAGVHLRRDAVRRLSLLRLWPGRAFHLQAPGCRRRHLRARGGCRPRGPRAAGISVLPRDRVSAPGRQQPERRAASGSLRLATSGSRRTSRKTRPVKAAGLAPCAGRDIPDSSLRRASLQRPAAGHRAARPRPIAIALRGARVCLPGAGSMRRFRSPQEDGQASGAIGSLISVSGASEASAGALGALIIWFRAVPGRSLI